MTDLQEGELTATSGDGLKRERDTGDFSQEALARAMGVSVKTVQRIEKSDEVRVRDVAAYRMALSKLYSERASRSNSPDNYVPRATPDLEEATYLPAHLRTAARLFSREMDRLGANDEELNYIDATLHSDHVAVLVQIRPDGTRRTPAEMDAEFQLQIQAMQRWLELHMDFRGASPAAMRAKLEPRDKPMRRGMTAEQIQREQRGDDEKKA